MNDHPAERLSAYADGVLAPGDAALVAAHLAECGPCREILDDLRAVRAVLRSAPAPAPHPAALPRTLARLGARPRSVRRWLGLVALAAAALVVALQLPLAPTGPADLGDDAVYYQTHARFAVSHPIANITLATYLSTALPYQPPGATAPER